MRVRSTRPRDSQVSKLYKAERESLWGQGQKLPTVSDVEQFIQRLRETTTVRQSYPELIPPIRVKDGRGTRWARGGLNHISLPSWARNEETALHELAHTITQRRYGYNKVSWHGWEFAQIYLDLVRLVMGSKHSEALKVAFKTHGVRYKPKAKRVMTDEAKQALRERLVVARAARRKD